jgi:hypothetical protein
MDQGGLAVNLSSYAREAISLCLNVPVTVCNDIAGYIHTVSLPWALQKESKLTFNSNLRLFTRARHSTANSWYTNLLMIVLMIMSYASNALIFIDDSSSDNLPAGTNTFVCGYAAITLGIAILGQAAVATMSLLSSVNVPTWSSDPLETAAACMSFGNLRHAHDRCLRGVHERQEPSTPVVPRRRQKSAYSAHKEVRIIIWCMWIPVILAAIWSGTIMVAIYNYRHRLGGIIYGGNWSFFPVIDTGMLSARDMNYH